MYTKRVPGPYPLSCITCRERRKKCDRTHPTCNRCREGGFTCLGYTSRDVHHTAKSRSSSQVDSTYLFSSSTPLSDRSNDARTLPITTDKFQPVSTTSCSQSQLSQSPLRHGPPPQSPVLFLRPLTDISFASGPREPPDDAHIYNIGSSVDFYPTGGSEANQNHMDLPPNYSTRRYTNRSACDVAGTGGDSIHQSEVNELGHMFYRDPDTSVVATEFITSQYVRAYSLMAIELVSHQESFVQICILPNIAISQGACWSLFIGAKIYQAVTSGYGSKAVKQHVQDLDQFGQLISATNRHGITTRELSGWLMAALELVELRFLVDPQLAYRTQRLAIPIFMELAQTEPTFWRYHNSGPSLHSVGLSIQPGLARFATMDVAGSFIFGLPQMITWDPIFIPELAHLPWDEWIPGLPLYFLLVLCAINTWREQDPRDRNPNEWSQYERSVLDWRAQHIYRSDHSDSWRTIGRLIVQEAYRHMTLIYLYM
ncbi:unnamed protein product, partial [Rhizoctonia solani]